MTYARQLGTTLKSWEIGGINPFISVSMLVSPTSRVQKITTRSRSPFSKTVHYIVCYRFNS